MRRSDEAAAPPASRSPGLSQRQHILATALSLMATQGVDGTSMRNLAAATGLNVASLYHYFPSKRDLLVAVLQDRGFVGDMTAASEPSVAQESASTLEDLLGDMLESMLEVEDFIRLMIGETMRGDDTAYSVGKDLFTATEASLEQAIAECDPPPCRPGEEAAMARMIRSLVVGLFIEHVSGVLSDSGDTAEQFRKRVEEIAGIIQGRK
jgi:AcrR family transcriptional regulator